MLNFDEKSIKRLNNPKIKTEDKLYLISRFIEEKYNFKIQPNHWDDAFSQMNIKEYVFYKIWLWLCYVELENLIPPISEFELVYGKQLKEKLEGYLNLDTDERNNLDRFYHSNGEAGEILLKWALIELNLNNKES